MDRRVSREDTEYFAVVAGRLTTHLVRAAAAATSLQTRQRGLGEAARIASEGGTNDDIRAVLDHFGRQADREHQEVLEEGKVKLRRDPNQERR